MGPLPLLPRPQGRTAAPRALSTGQPAVDDPFIGPTVKTRLAAVTDSLPVLGLQVDAQASGEAAVQRAAAALAAGQPHEVLLIDWKMQPIDGIATLHPPRSVRGLVCRRRSR